MTERRKSAPVLLYDALDQHLRNRPYGAIRKMERDLDLCRGWWHGRARSKSLDTRELHLILDYLGLDPVDFIRRCWGEVNGLELDRPQGDPPEIVTKALARLREGVDAEGVGEDFLADLEEQRYHDPAAALSVLDSAVELASAKEIPRLLGIAGLAHWALIRLREAEHCFLEAIYAAEGSDNHLRTGHLLRSFSYVFGAQGKHDRALRLVVMASAILLREGDSVGLGKVCVEQGNWLSYLGRKKESLQAFFSALRLLPESERRYRCTAYQGLGLVYNDLGQPAEARKHLESAMAYVDSLSLHHRAKIAWLQAGIHNQLGEFDEAEGLLKGAIELLRRVHHGETAIATCDLVQVLLLQGKSAQAFHTALSMRVLVEPLADNPVISAAIADLLRSGREGLTLALVEEIGCQIEGERRRKKAWRELGS